MLQPTDEDYLVNKQRYKDLIRQAERECQISSAIPQHSCNLKTHHRLIGWVSDQMVKLLQRYTNAKDA